MPGSASSEPTIPTETGNQPQPAKEPEPMEKVKKSKRKAEKTVQKETPSEETSAENLKIFYNLLLEDEESVKKDVRKITKEHQEFLCKPQRICKDIFTTQKVRIMTLKRM